MAGLLKNSKNFTLDKWYKIFKKQKNSFSNQAYAHWKYAEYLGFPNNKNEDWKHFSLDNLMLRSFVSATRLTDQNKINISEYDHLNLNLDAYRLVFVNGYFSEELSDNNIGVWSIKIEKGIDRTSISEPIKPDFFLHLTESLSQETSNIYISSDKTSNKLLYILHISVGMKHKKKLTTLYYRHHLDIGNGSNCKVFEHFVSLDNQEHFSNARTSINIGDNVNFSHIKLIDENHKSYHISHNDIKVGKNTIIHSNFFVIFCSNLIRNQTSIQLNGEKSKIFINSLAFPKLKDIMDIQTYLEHNCGYCFSRQKHKMIISENGHGIFNGLIKIQRNALKSDGKMNNNNLLLDTFSKINSQPKLEIYIDDVKCSHGTTVGNIDNEQIFYLRSRGIAYENSKKMIIYAFASELIKLVDHREICDIIFYKISKLLKNIAI